MTIGKSVIFLIGLTLAGCASSPGGGSATQVGAMSVIDGIEVWTGGAPSRPYRVIATVQREGADDSANYRDEEILLASDARRRGADAVIVLDAVMVASRMDLADSRPLLAPKVDAQLIGYR